MNTNQKLDRFKEIIETLMDDKGRPKPKTADSDKLSDEMMSLLLDIVAAPDGPVQDTEDYDLIIAAVEAGMNPTLN